MNVGAVKCAKKTGMIYEVCMHLCVFDICSMFVFYVYVMLFYEDEKKVWSAFIINILYSRFFKKNICLN